LARGDPNPLASLWVDARSGRRELGSGDHKPSAAVEFDLTVEQYEAIRRYIRDYDYRRFSIRDRVCTDFVAGAARLAGIRLGHRVALNVPQQTRIGGRTIRWWTDPRYAQLTFGSPDVLERSLKQAVARGLGRDVLREYGQ
jgi:hypothetical protein